MVEDGGQAMAQQRSGLGDDLMPSSSAVNATLALLYQLQATQTRFACTHITWMSVDSTENLVAMSCSLGPYSKIFNIHACL
jgi:hypothetical protein